jgi:RsmE family RNA methyltransferase
VGRALQTEPAAGGRVLLAVGPEGGWIDRERELLQRVGFQTVQAGPRVLSTEVACCVLLGLVHEALAL